MAGLPVRVILEIERRCGFRCRHCRNWRQTAPPPDAFTFTEYEKLVGSLADWLGADGWRLHLGLGEPLLSPHLPGVLAAASRRRLRTTLVTNGALVEEGPLLETLRARASAVAVSIDGRRPETHDRLRGVPGAFERASRALGLLSRPGAGPSPRVGVVSIMMRDNLEELPELARWACGPGRASEIIFNPLHRAVERWPELWPDDPGRVDAVVDELIALKRAGLPILNPEEQLSLFKRYFRNPDEDLERADCSTAWSLRIRADGTAYLCDFGMEPVGSVRGAPLPELWASAGARARRREIAACRRTCALVSCNYRRSPAA